MSFNSESGHLSRATYKLDPRAWNEWMFDDRIFVPNRWTTLHLSQAIGVRTLRVDVLQSNPNAFDKVWKSVLSSYGNKLMPSAPWSLKPSDNLLRTIRTYIEDTSAAYINEMIPNNKGIFSVIFQAAQASQVSK